jgi:Phosphotransferase system, mannose/fructose/N-acetylgalactosamine-specific component IID
MAPGYFYTVLPFLKRWYKDEELVEMMQMQSQFFNVNAFDGNFIIGMDLAIEEKQGSKAKETIAGLKTGLMGPLAGVGDTILVLLFLQYVDQLVHIWDYEEILLELSCG